MAAESNSLLPWLRLSLVPGLTGANWRRLAAAFGPPAAVLHQGQRALAQVVDAALAAAIIQGPASEQLEAALAWAQAEQRTLLTEDDPRYPPLLAQTPDPPPVLYASGRLELLQQPAVAIVGSRNATAQGMRNAEQFAQVLSAAGICIVSGMALGIDAAAHDGGLSAQGSTVAVLGSGIDIVYPRRNAELFERVATRGLLISEFPLGTPPFAANFPRRNRIISGLACGCLVVEAAMASGSLITARMAVDMGRDVFAIPGSIHSPLTKGCHYLIKQGAKLVESAQDVLEELGYASPLPAIPVSRAPADPGPEARRVLEALGHEPCDLDTLAERTAFAVDKLLALLTQLEIDAHISRDGGRYQRLS